MPKADSHDAIKAYRVAMRYVYPILFDSDEQPEAESVEEVDHNVFGICPDALHKQESLEYSLPNTVYCSYDDQGQVWLVAFEDLTVKVATDAHGHMAVIKGGIAP